MATKPEDKQIETTKLLSPKTSVLIRTRLRALHTGLLPSLHKKGLLRLCRMKGEIKATLLLDAIHMGFAEPSQPLNHTLPERTKRKGG